MPVTVVTWSPDASNVAALPTEVARTVRVNGPLPTGIVAGMDARTTNVDEPPTGIEPVSAMPSPLLSSASVAPSDWNSVNAVPAGKVFDATPMLNTSAALPVLNTVCVKFTLPPDTMPGATFWSAPAVPNAPRGVPGVVSIEVPAEPVALPRTTP